MKRPTSSFGAFALCLEPSLVNRILHPYLGIPSVRAWFQPLLASESLCAIVVSHYSAVQRVVVFSLEPTDLQIPHAKARQSKQMLLLHGTDRHGQTNKTECSPCLSLGPLGLSCFLDGTPTEAFCQTGSIGSKAAPDPAKTILSSLQFPRHPGKKNLVQISS